MATANSSPLWADYSPQDVTQHSLYEVLSGNPAMFSLGGGNTGPEGGWQSAATNPMDYGIETGKWVTKDDKGYQDWFLQKSGVDLSDPQAFFNNMNQSSVFNYDPASGMVNTYRDPEIEEENKTPIYAGEAAKTLAIFAAMAASAGAASGAFAGAGAAGTAGTGAAAGEMAVLGGETLAANGMSMVGSAGPMSTTPALQSMGNAGIFSAGAGTGASIFTPEAGGPGIGDAGAFDQGGMGTEFMNSNYAPVEEMSRMFNPATSGGFPDLGNLAASLTNSGSFGNGVGSFFSPSGGSGIFGGFSPSNMLSVGSSLYSAYDARKRAKELQEMSQQSMSKIEAASANADPWGASGGRSNAAQMLMAMQADPSGEMAKDPRFAAMIQAAQRATAQYGQNSGAMNVAGAKAGGDWFTQRQAELAGLAGTGNAGIPVQGMANAGQIGLQGNIAANTLAGQGLASLGFGLNTATGGGAMNNIPPQVLQWMRSQGMRV